MKTVCVYHSIDLDGWMSAAVVKHWFEENVRRVGDDDVPVDTLDFVGYNYGQPIPNLSDYERVIMCDIVLPKEIMLNLYKTIRHDLIWIDHHRSAIVDIDFEHLVGPDPIRGIRDEKFAACELTWKYFFPHEPMPELVRLLGRYDCFGHKGTDEETYVLEFQYGARDVIGGYEAAYSWLKSSMTCEREDVCNIHQIGKSIYHFLCQDALQSFKNGFRWTYFYATDMNGNCPTPVKFMVINKERFNPINFGIKYHETGYDGCACFHFNGKNWSFSLYNDNGLVDVSVIAKQYGGGGHKGAAGFVTNDISQFIKQ